MRYTALILIVLVPLSTPLGCSAPSEESPSGSTDTASIVVEDDAPVWDRATVSLHYAGISGNPFEVTFGATFIHRSSGTALTMPGYYAGADTFRINFMPIRAGRWSYQTSSTEPALAGKSGSLVAEASRGRGMLRPDSARPKRWKFTRGPYVIPIALRTEFFSEPGSLQVFEHAARVLAENNVHLLETRLTEEKGMFEGGRHDFIFRGDWRNHRFDIRIWDRMQQRMDALADLGLGAHVMFYSDDGGKPGWGGQTETERLVLRYAVARLAAYPTVIWNTGIDIAEYRSDADIDWMGERLAALDPYDHPRSSRRGGGSGSIVMDNENFESFGGPNRARYPRMLRRWRNADRAISFDDAWGEEYPELPSRNHSPGDIRRGGWKSLLVGGAGFLIRGSGDGLPEPGYFSIHHLEDDWDSEQWLRLLNPFLQDHLADSFPNMESANGLAAGAGVYALATHDRRLILYFAVGANDSNEEGGGKLMLLLESLSGTWRAQWFDPRNGSIYDAGSFSGGQNHSVFPPTTSDWLLILRQR